jgi:hypothetical protein
MSEAKSLSKRARLRISLQEAERHNDNVAMCVAQRIVGTTHDCPLIDCGLKKLVPIGFGRIRRQKRISH